MIRNFLLFALFTGIVGYIIWHEIGKPDTKTYSQEEMFKNYSDWYNQWICDGIIYLVKTEYPKATCEIIPTSTGAGVIATKINLNPKP